MVSFYTPVAQLLYHTHSPRIGLNLNTVYSPYCGRQHPTYLSFCYLLSTFLPLIYLHGSKNPQGISRPSSIPGWAMTVPLAVTDMTSTTFLTPFHIPVGIASLWRVLAFALRLKRVITPNSEHSNFSLFPCSCPCT